MRTFKINCATQDKVFYAYIRSVGPNGGARVELDEPWTDGYPLGSAGRTDAFLTSGGFLYLGEGVTSDFLSVDRNDLAKFRQACEPVKFQQTG